MNEGTAHGFQSAALYGNLQRIEFIILTLGCLADNGGNRITNGIVSFPKVSHMQV